MARSDYAHHNEEADLIWYQEEGKHHEDNEPNAPDDHDDQYYGDPNLWDEEPPDPHDGEEG